MPVISDYSNQLQAAMQTDPDNLVAKIKVALNKTAELTRGNAGGTPIADDAMLVLLMKDYGAILAGILVYGGLMKVCQYLKDYHDSKPIQPRRLT